MQTALSMDFSKLIFDNNSHPQRMIIVPSSAMGALRKELIDTLGYKRAKGFLLRYGWNCGVADTIKLLQNDSSNEMDKLLAGPQMLTYTGQAKVEPLVCEYDIEKKKIHYEGNWIDSYEANEHLRLFGKSTAPVCNTLVGYASACVSTIIGKKVYVKETMCKAMGDDHCHWIAKAEEDWGDDFNFAIEQQLYLSENIGNELEDTYKKLLKERDNLSKTYQVHGILVKELLYETGLNSITSIFYQTTSIPIIIEDNDFNIVAVGGLSTKEAQRLSDELKSWFADQKSKKGSERKDIKDTMLLDIAPDHKRLITPIYFRKRVYGYCSLISTDKNYSDVDSMMLEQTALACSLQILNERTRFFAEQQMKGSFLEDILSKRISMPEIVKRSHYVDFQLLEPFFMITINRRSEDPSTEDDADFDDHFMNDLVNHFKKKGVKGLFGNKNGNFNILLSEGIITKNYTKKEAFCRQLMDYCTATHPQSKFKMGISSSASSIEGAANLYDESLAALKVTNRHQSIVFFESLGLVGMLLQTKDLATIEKFAHKVLGDLIEEDKHKNMELIKTLYHYLENGSNVHKTARAMNFSISGLRYRMGRLNEILKTDINTPYFRHEIYLALQSLIVLGELEVD